MEYDFREIEKKWQRYWANNKTFRSSVMPEKPKYYVLDMFPYPSGAGLHVGHPLGYIATDIISRQKRMEGFNVLHPMGFDAFGLPAEQYAIQTGQHPAKTTEINIKRYREQLDKIGLSFDWDAAVVTSDPDYYHWTQWVFIRLFEHWYDKKTDKALPIQMLREAFAQGGSQAVEAACTPHEPFTASEWAGMSDIDQQKTLLNYRIAYLSDTMVNWCEKLGTVLANDEVKDGFSIRGNHPVVQKKMQQWSLRVSAYAQRLLDGLDRIDWSEAIKETQRNWIGRSTGAEILFDVHGHDLRIQIFTTRPDTIFGATFMVLAPEHEWAQQLTTDAQRRAVEAYREEVAKRTERERIAETRRVTGVFTGSYALNPFTRKPIPIWLADYVLAGYGTGAIMAVPAHDSRDHAFAKAFQLPIVPVIEGGDTAAEAYESKTGKLINSQDFNGLEVPRAIEAINAKVEQMGIGKAKTNYRLRDAIFSRQRYWGEPFPVFYKDGMPQTLPDDQLPLVLPEVEKYLPTEDGQPPLGRARNWHDAQGNPYELSTMPGFAGSSAYYFRYMDSKNSKELVSKEANGYWRSVDLYVGGSEHATGHLIYSRFWNKFLFDLGLVCEDEPFKKLINQGMIQGRSNFVYRVNNRKYAEAVLWEKLNSDVLGFKFKRDYNFDHAIYTFCCEEKKLIIECSAGKTAQKFLDEHQGPLRRSGYRLLVLSIEEIVEDLDAVLRRAAVLLDDREALPEHDFSKASKEAYLPLFVSKNLVRPEHQPMEIHVEVSLVRNDQLDLEAFRHWRIEYEKALFVLEGGVYHCGWAVEKMSKSLHNVVNPDDIIEDFGADTLRLYEMFLGPLQSSKPWDTNGIDGVHKFLLRVWRLFHNAQNKLEINDDEPTAEEWKSLHKTIKKVRQDIEELSFNTSVAAFMICVNELSQLKCRKRAILDPFIRLLSPFAPHLAEEIWQRLGHRDCIAFAPAPSHDEKHLVESQVEYPVSFNGKTRFLIVVPAQHSQELVSELALSSDKAQKWLEGKTPKKVIVVPNRIVNIVL